MRIDQYLKKTHLAKQREAAKELCAQQLVKINGQYTKPGRPVREGDIIEIETIDGARSYEVLAIPEGNIKKGEAGRYYRQRSG